MILTAMPDLPPRPATNTNTHFRSWYFARWGRENALICGRTQHAEYSEHTQTLSIKAAWGGTERYFLPEREVAVDDDNLLILNEGCRCGSLMRGARPRIELRRRLLLAADHIESNHAQPLTLARIASVACLSPYHLVRRFGQMFGITPHGYLLRKRARVAERLLSEGRDDIDTIAAACGFGSRSSMRRALKRHGRQRSAISAT